VEPVGGPHFLGRHNDREWGFRRGILTILVRVASAARPAGPVATDDWRGSQASVPGCRWGGMLGWLHVRVGPDSAPGREKDARRALWVASVLAMLLIVAAAGVSIWRYEAALHHSDSALGSSADALRVERAGAAFSRERGTIAHFMLQPAPALLAKVEREQTSFEAMTRELRGSDPPTRALTAAARKAAAGFGKTFTDDQHLAGLGTSAELAATRRLDAAEAAVLQPLDTLRSVYLQEVRERRAARNATDSEALVAALLSGFFAFFVVGGLSLYCGRLLRGVQARRSTELAVNQAHHEYTEMLQAAESEEEADQLLKRQAERSIACSSVVVLRRNNSADRLLPTTEADSVLVETLADAAPRSCLAVRFGRMHQQGEGTEPLIGCAVCSCEDGYSTCQPLLVGGEVLGAALVRHPSPLSDLERRTFVATVGQAGPVLANLRNLALARFRAATDALTGLPNSREVQDTLKRMTAHASRTVSPLAALMLDLDHFKEINDSHGHARGDDVLAALGTTIRAALRASDFVGRYGGEEFVILLPDTGREEAGLVAEKIRAAVAAINVSGVTRPITASIGLAILPDDAGDSGTLLRNADRALYAAKSNGRNRVEVATHGEPSNHRQEPAQPPGEATVSPSAA
jgi:diguanylate cyclase (GGDEF)-like protein